MWSSTDRKRNEVSFFSDCHVRKKKRANRTVRMEDHVSRAVRDFHHHHIRQLAGEVMTEIKSERKRSRKQEIVGVRNVCQKRTNSHIIRKKLSHFFSYAFLGIVLN